MTLSAFPCQPACACSQQVLLTESLTAAVRGTWHEPCCLCLVQPGKVGAFLLNGIGVFGRSTLLFVGGAGWLERGTLTV
jgi:hypothetical protein